MASDYAQDIASKIIDVIDDYIEIPSDGRDVKIRAALEQLIDNAGLEAASANMDPTKTYAIKLAALKQKIITGITNVMDQVK